MDDLITAVDGALRDRGWSAQHASRMIGASPEFIRNLRRGNVASIKKCRDLLEVLGLEFYVGPTREVGAVDEQRLEKALTAVERALGELPFALTPEDKASAVTAIYAFMSQERSPATATRMTRILTTMFTRK